MGKVVHLMCTFYNLRSLFLRKMSLKSKSRYFSYNQSTCRVTQYTSTINLFMASVIQHFQHLPKHFLLRLLAERQVTASLRTWSIGPAGSIHQANLGKNASDLNPWMGELDENVDKQEPYVHVQRCR